MSITRANAQIDIGKCSTSLYPLMVYFIDFPSCLTKLYLNRDTVIYNFVYSYFKKRCQKKSKHPISQEEIWVVSRASRDLCYMLPALLACFKNSHITLQPKPMGFCFSFGNVFGNCCIHKICYEKMPPLL